MFKAQQIIDAIQGRPGAMTREGKPEGSSMGIKSVIAQRLGCSRDTVDRYIDRYVTIKAAFQEERERLVDIAEIKLLDRVKAGEWPAIRYVLSTLGKDRGYTERTEVTGAEGGAVELAIVDKLKRVVEMSEDEFTDFAGTVPDLGSHGTLEKMAEVEG